MEVNPNLKVGSVPRTPPDQPVVRRSGSGSEEAAVQFTESQALNLALADVPDLRVEAVEKARQLVGQVDYPPQETIQKLANLFAIHFSNSKNESDN